MKSPLTLALVGLVILLALSALPSTGTSPSLLSAGATPPAGPPVSFYGTLTINGLPAPDGTQIGAAIGGVTVGTTHVFSQNGQGGLYTLDIIGSPGQIVTFRSGTFLLTPDAILNGNGPQINNLSVVPATATTIPTATPTVIPASSATSISAPSATPTGTSVIPVPTGTVTPISTVLPTGTSIPTTTPTNTPAHVDAHIGQTYQLKGKELTLIITVSNNGPDDLIGAIVDDPLPDSAPGTTWAWTCTATGGADCGISLARTANDVRAGETSTPIITGTGQHQTAVRPPSHGRTGCLHGDGHPEQRPAVEQYASADSSVWGDQQAGCDTLRSYRWAIPSHASAHSAYLVLRPSILEGLYGRPSWPPFPANPSN